MGAVTLDMNVDVISAAIIMASRMTDGWVPTWLSTAVDSRLAIWCLERAEARIKLPSSKKMTCAFADA